MGSSLSLPWALYIPLKLALLSIHRIKIMNLSAVKLIMQAFTAWFSKL